MSNALLEDLSRDLTALYNRQRSHDTTFLRCVEVTFHRQDVKDGVAESLASMSLVEAIRILAFDLIHDEAANDLEFANRITVEVI